jgi:hypothetical protein
MVLRQKGLVGRWELDDWLLRRRSKPPVQTTESTG